MNKPLQPMPHAVLDYVVGLLLLVSPWLLGFNDISPVATMTMATVGVVVLLLSLMTDYPLGVIKAIPFSTHGVIETIGAIFLLVSPWLLGYNDVSGTATILAVAVSIVWLVVVALTNYSYSERKIYH